MAADPSEPQIYRYFATTVALITSAAKGRDPNVMACEWTFNVCWRPLRIMTIIHHSNTTHELIERGQTFGVNLCAEDQAALASYAGNVSGRDEPKLEHELFAGRVLPATVIEAPLIGGCLLNAECVVEMAQPLGEYTAFVGRAVAARVDPTRRPLFYHQGRFAGLGEWLPKPTR